MTKLLNESDQFKVTTTQNPTEQFTWKFNFLKNKAASRGFQDFDKWWPKTEEIIAYSLATLDDEEETPVCINVLQERPFYNGMCRVASRYYIDSVNNSLKTPWMAAKGDTRPFTAMMIDQQTAIAETLGYKGVFFSRNANYLILKNIYNGMMKRSKYNDWTLESKDKMYRLCDGDESCNQWVAWRGELTLCPTNL